MSGNEQNIPDGPDLEEIREEIDDLASQSTEELISPAPAGLAHREPTPEPTDAIGSESWDDADSED